MISGFWQKLGFWPYSLINEWKSKNNWIWFHAVSVGEFNVVYPLIVEVLSKKPMYPIMVSCTTSAGYKIAKERTKDKNVLVFYFPFDLPKVIESLLSYAKVKLLIIAETEIWPITLSTCKSKNIPVLLINARISDRSFKNYLLLKFYFKKIINLFTEVIAQSENDGIKFIKLGLNNKKLKIGGNLKYFIQTNQEDNNNKITNIDKTINIIFGSTHPGEEEIAINIFKELLVNRPNLRLLIAPRHMNRIKEIYELIKKNGFNPILRSENKKINSSKDILLIDTIGELISFYKISKITILGGTFVKIGGHNILEPISTGSYTIIGPYDFKISELSNNFKNRDAIVQVNNTERLKSTIIEALEDELLVENRIKNGKKIIGENEYIFKQTAEHIFTYI